MPKRTLVFLCFFVSMIGCRLSLAAQDTSQTAAKIVATIDGAAITEADLNRAAAAELENIEMEKMQHEAEYVRNRHQVMDNALKRLIEERIIDSQARREGLSPQALVAREVDAKVKDPTDEEADKFYEANKDRIRAPKEQVFAQIKQALKQQSYVKAKEEFLERLRKDRQITVALDPLRQDVAVAGHPSKGREQAPVTIVEFSDFQCPYCKSFNSTLDRVMKEFPADVRLVFRQLPLKQIHPMAEKAAEASLCAQEQGKFWELHDLMFKDQANLKVDDLKAKAAGLGLDASSFNSCLDSGKEVPRVQSDLLDGARAGADGTPSFFINGRYMNGAQPYEAVEPVIKEELQKRASGSAKPNANTAP